MLTLFFPDLESGQADWRRVSRRAIRRGTWKGSVVFVLLAAVLYAVQRHWTGLWPLAFIPVVYVLNVMSYRHLGTSSAKNTFAPDAAGSAAPPTSSPSATPSRSGSARRRSTGGTRSEH